MIIVVVMIKSMEVIGVQFERAKELVFYKK